MTLQPVTVQQFGGLDLVSDPPETQGAVDLLNVDLNQLGRIRTRDGQVQEVALTAGTPTLIQAAGATLYIARGSSIDKVVSGTATTLGTFSGIMSAAAIGTPTTSLVFFAGSSTALSKWDGTTFAASSCSSSARFVAVSPWDNRLIQAYLTSSPTGSSATATTSTVVFSDAGAPETYSANNFDYLHPGDGEDITGMVTWREMVFVVKQTRLFIYYGVSSSGTGTPIFNYRTMDLPSQVRGAFGVMSAGADGVYLVCKDGIYRSAGDVPQKISQRVNGIFDGSAVDDIRIAQAGGTGNVNAGPVRLGWALGRLYMAYTNNNGANQWLVWDSHMDEWMLYRFGTGSVAYPPPATVGGELYTAKSTSLLRFTSTATDDAGTAIASYYQSGWSDYGTPARKRLGRVALWGSGSPTFSVFSDRGAADSAAGAVTLGTAPAVVRTEQPKERVGRQLSWKVAATSGAWNVSSIELDLADSRVTP